MTMATSNEQRFVADVDAFEFITLDVTSIVHSMEDWLERLQAQLRSNRLTWRGLNERSVLAEKADAINRSIHQGMVRWMEQWQSYEPAHAFADSFDDKVLLLIFGKFNAGKSSLCNFLADRFNAHDKEVRYFYLDGGQILETPERFKEGVTETTSRLQGVRLATRLVLLDTPGLHSVTPENAALTQRFTDSADGVLWLTSSTSPGQVQELDELARELHRNKPLLPVITRSDVYEEDEVDGEICKVLRNKTAENRAEQEADVEARASEKLLQMGVAPALLKPPVSISTYLAREDGQTPTAMNEAGFERLFAALDSITEQTLAYKRRKQAEVLLHHLEENVLDALNDEVVSSLRETRGLSDLERDTLDNKQDQLANALWRAVVPALPEVLDAYFVIRDLNAVAERLSNSVRAALLVHIHTLLREYAIDLSVLDTTLTIESEESAFVYQSLHEALTRAVRNIVVRLASEVIDQCRAALLRLDKLMQGLEVALCTHEAELLVMKRNLQREVF